MPQPDYATLNQWESSHYRILQAAAAITRQLQGKQPQTPVTASRPLAAALDFTPATINRAQRFLAAEGILRKGPDNCYYTT